MQSNAAISVSIIKASQNTSGRFAILMDCPTALAEMTNGNVYEAMLG